VVTNVVTNAAAAAILTPVAITVANSAGLNPVILLTLIGTCISLTFLNPIAHQTNLMVMGPGGYSTKMFVRFGIPVTIVALAVAITVGYAFLK
jgi:di/tricarboxylate transporter